MTTLEEAKAELRAWLAPIPGPSAVGSDVSLDPGLLGIAAQAPASSGHPVDWQRILREADAILRGQSKDLWVAVYLAHALHECRQRAGLAVGCTLLAELMERYWETMFPGRQEGWKRASAVQWFIDRSLETYPGSWSGFTPEVRLALKAAVSRLSEVVEARFPLKPPKVGLLVEMVGRFEALAPPRSKARPLPAAAPKVPVAPAPPPQSAPAPWLPDLSDMPASPASGSWSTSIDDLPSSEEGTGSHALPPDVGPLEEAPAPPPPASRALPAAEATIYATVRPTNGLDRVKPDEVKEYVLRLGGTPTVGVSRDLNLSFPREAPSVSVHAELSSSHFAQVPGEAWNKTFRVGRDLKATPDEWAFKLRPVGDLLQYTFEIRFHAAGVPAGRLIVTAEQAGAKGPAVVAPSRLVLPSRSGARLVVKVSDRAGDVCAFSVYRNDELVAESEGWLRKKGERLLESLRRPLSSKGLAGLAFYASKELPAEVVQATWEDGGVDPVLFISEDRVAPFELMAAHGKPGDAPLGLERPVVRWTSEPAPKDADLDATRLALVRPTYSAASAVRGEEEEAWLSKELAPAVVVHSMADFLSKVLTDGQLGAVHFAGHAQGQPAELRFGEGALDLLQFPASLLMTRGKPFFFLNACETGAGLAGQVSYAGNMAGALIQCGARAIVAPLVAVHVDAALRAAKVFYAAVKGGAAVGEAVCRVRKLALEAGVDDAARASYLAYAAFARGDLRLRL
jgi:hypothetical protein